MRDLTGFQRDLLVIIASHNDDDEIGPKGLEIKREIEEYYNEKINHGRLYPNLDELVKKGLVAKGSTDGRTNSYNLTRRGEREVKSRKEWEQEKLTAGNNEAPAIAD
jgi:DNA-binding PadR family transcriptional regulator